MPSLPGDGMSGLFMPGNTILRMALAHITDTPASAVPVPPQRPSPASSPSPSSAGITVQANRKGFIETVGAGDPLSSFRAHAHASHYDPARRQGEGGNDPV